MINSLLEQDYRSILCLNGDLPDPAFFRRYKLPLIAADGAANTLKKMAIAPDMIIGDLDSVDDAVRNEHPSLLVACQNSSDFQKAIRYLQEEALLPAIIVGVNGGYLDHILNNINIFMETNSLFYAPPLVGWVIKKDRPSVLTLPINTKISIFGIPTASISSNGLQWELNAFQLSFPGQTSCFNRSVARTVQLNVHEGAVLVMVYEGAA